MIYPGFIGPSSQTLSPVADVEQLVNLYMEPSDGSASGRPALYGFPGIAQYLDLPSADMRAMAEMNGRCFVVNGDQLYEVLDNGVNITANALGAVYHDQNLASIRFNGPLTALGLGNQALIASAGLAYILNLTTLVLTPVLSQGEASQIGMLDGFFLAFNATTGRMRLSALNNGLSWDPTQFFSRSAGPDQWVAFVVLAPDIILLGSQTGDIWYDAGSFPVPFAPRQGFTFKYGCVAPASLAVAGQSVLWLSRTAEGAGTVVLMNGYRPQPIGSYAFDSAVANYELHRQIADAEAMVLTRAGHPWYVLRFPSANATWAYDLRTTRWTQLGHWNSLRGAFDSWKPRVTCHAFDKNLVGDATGRIGNLDETVATEADGSAIRRVRIPPALVAQEGSRVFVDRFSLDLETGLGASGDPAGTVLVRWSKDFGRTWSSEQRLGVGAIGDYGHRVFHTIAGSSLKAMVPEVVITDPFPMRIVGAEVQGRGIATPQTTR